MSRFLTTNEVIKQFKEVHGDKYDYSLVKYNCNKIKVKIICPEHGVFEQIPQLHKKGAGCNKCRFDLKKKTVPKKVKPISPEEKTKMLIKEFKEVHGDRYDYSLVKFVNSKTKVKIICKKHGVFEQSYFYHKNGSNCMKCRNIKKGLSQEEVISRFKRVHGNRYDYSLVKFKKIKEKVKIICKEHGVFEQIVDSHFGGAGCPKCAGQKLTKTDLIKEFKKIHGDRYDYSKVKISNHKTKVEIICKKHGSFFQSIYHHKIGCNCPKCANVRYNTEDLIKEFRKVHGNEYDYSKTDFINYKHKIKVICKEHGEFLINPMLHKSGSKCPICSNVRVKLTKEDVIRQFKKTHGNRYDYSKVKYINWEKKVKIICKEHGEFEQLAWNHKKGHNCPICMQNTGYKFNLSGILYYIRVDRNGQVAYKIGITNRSIKERFNSDMKYITVLREWHYEDGKECHEEEQRILQEFKYAKWKDEALLRDGNTELFDRDVLLLDIN